LDSSWFPAIEPEKSYNVFTFTFRNCENGCKSFEREKWYLDVQAAVEYAYELDGIDKDNIVMIGASIGSDGAADGCAYLNQVHPDACKGALSFSPGNYLTIDYGEMVKELGAASDPKPVWCLYAESDPESAAVCGNITENNYTPYSYPPDVIFSNGHGMNLISPDQDPDPLGLMLKFLAMVS
jgi:dienelactone hydrolase